MKIILSVLVIASIVVASQLHLTPYDVCGCFTTANGAWSCQPPSDITLSYDERGLALQGVFNKNEGETFIGKGNADDDMSVFGGDILEFQVNPPNADNVYYHIAFSPSGFAYTARQRDISWNPKGMERESKPEGNKWAFKLFVPYEDMGTQKPQDGVQWRVNIARTNIDAQGTVETASFSGASDFHDTQQYTVVTFGGKATEPKPILKGLSSDGDSIKFMFERIANPAYTEVEYSIGDRKMMFQLVQEGKYWVFTAPLHDGYVPMKAASVIAVKLKDKKTGKILFEKAAHQPEKYLNNDLMPDKFYYLANDGDIVLDHSFGAQAVITLFSETGKVLQVKAASSQVKLPLANLAPGRYIVEIRNETKRTSRVFFVLPEKPQLRPISENASFKITESNYFELDGTPTFLLGMSDSAKYFLHFEPAMNLLYARKGGQLNGVVNRGMPTGGKLHRRPITAYQFPDIESSAKSVRDFASKIDSKIPALYRIRYEAQIPGIITHEDGTTSLEDTKERFKRMYTEAKKANPDVIYSIHIDRKNRIDDFVQSCDVFEIALWSSSYAINLMYNLPNDIDFITQKITDKPVIYWLGGTVPNNKCRTAEELRCAAYYCILRGVDGCIIHLGHGYLPEERSRVWSLLSGILAEIQDFYADFVTGKDITQDFQSQCSKDICYKAVRTKQGNIMILAVNISPVEKTFCIKHGDKTYEKCLTPLEPIIIRE